MKFQTNNWKAFRQKTVRGLLSFPLIHHHGQTETPLYMLICSAIATWSSTSHSLSELPQTFCFIYAVHYASVIVRQRF